MGISVVDRTGQRYGMLLALELKGLNRHRRPVWHCLCDCGRHTTVSGANLQSGATKSCGCARAIDRTGQRYGRLIAVERVSNRRKTTMWLCHCDCGKQVVVGAGNLQSGKTSSCGCARTKHGRSRTPEYKAWHSMLRRCDNPNQSGYKNYGGRGIHYDPRFVDPEVFLVYAESKPPGTTLDRTDNENGYVVGNLRWATRKEQQRNRRNNRLVEYEGEVLCVAELAERLGLKYSTLRQRINRWPPERWAEPRWISGRR